MSENVELVPLAHLFPGMVLGDVLLDAHGNLLLAEGAVLSEATIGSLARHGVAAAPIVRAAPASEPDPDVVQKRLDHLGTAPAWMLRLPSVMHVQEWGMGRRSPQSGWAAPRSSFRTQSQLRPAS